MGDPALYQGRDPRKIAAYGIIDAARYLHIPPATLRSWMVGRAYPKQEGVGAFAPLIEPADAKPIRLSFNNLVEAHVLRALRTQHGVPIQAIRDALTYAEREMKINRLLLSKDLSTHAGDLFLEYFGQLINLTKSGQLAIKKVLEAHLQRVDWDKNSVPLRLYPFLSSTLVDEARTIVIDPNVAFGRPTIVGSGITTAVLTRRIDAGESINDLAHDYDIPASKIEEGIIFEKAA